MWQLWHLYKLLDDYIQANICQSQPLLVSLSAVAGWEEEETGKFLQISAGILLLSPPS